MPVDFIFITGSGRCGTSLTRNLMDSHSQIEVIPDEVTDLLGQILRVNGYSRNFSLSGPVEKVIYHNLVRAYKGLPDENNIYDRYQALVSESLAKTFSLKDFMVCFVDHVLQSTKSHVLIDITNPCIKGLLEEFPDSKIIHLIRHPLNTLNSQYRFRYSDANSFGGSFPGSWELSATFNDISQSFLQAKEFKKHAQVKIVRLEELQNKPIKLLDQICKFVGVQREDINSIQTRGGRNEQGVSSYSPQAGVFAQQDDWSCLTPSDLFYGSSIDSAREFYDFPVFSLAPNGYLKFLKRQLGFTGKNRKKIISPIKFFKILIISIPQYFQDVRNKHYLQGSLNIAKFRDYPSL